MDRIRNAVRNGERLNKPAVVVFTSGTRTCQKVVSSVKGIIQEKGHKATCVCMNIHDSWDVMERFSIEARNLPAIVFLNKEGDAIHTLHNDERTSANVEVCLASLCSRKRGKKAESSQTMRV